MEWTRDKTLSLITEYRKRRGLWDMTHDDYRKKDIKHKLLIEVSNSLGEDIAIVEIEKKFHTLRTQYHREINRMNRKQPYDSKWFGFKNLQFLSSPKACRSSKGRVKSEITEDGTVTKKYIPKEDVQQHDTSGGSNTSGSNVNEEFGTIHRKSNNSFDASSNTGNCRAQELEKLIEETTKDVEDVEDSKPKMNIKEINETYSHHTYQSTPLHISSNGGEHELIHHQQSQDQQHIVGHLEEMASTAGTEEAINAYHASTNVTANQPHTNGLTRIIKIQRNGTGTEENYYDDSESQNQTSTCPSLVPQPSLTTHHIHTLPATTKRIYYDANGNQHTTTILATTSPSAVNSPPGPTTAILTSTGIKVRQAQQQSPPQLSQSNVSLSSVGAQKTPSVLNTSQQKQQKPQSQQQSPQQQQQQQTTRDEYSTYGEYVANELRGITNKQILISLKHKINTALFEANMAEFHK